MHLLHLKCRGFRCLDNVHFEPATGLNIIRGNNAQGKTSVLEAILFAATSKSHRTSVETDLVAHDGDGFHIEVKARRGDRDVTLEANWWGGAKRFKVNGVAQTRVSQVLGKVNVILFSPEDIALVKGAASVRRRFIDMELSQLHPAYLKALQQFRQVLRQRNELLRKTTVDDALLDVWDEQLVRHGALLMQERAGFLKELAELAAGAYSRIAGGEALVLEYRADVEPAEAYAEILKKSRAQDIRRRATSRGPHRDDIDFLVAGNPARSHASQGQQKSAALALKLAELELVNARTGEYPILMLDEVLSELDGLRAGQLFATIGEGIQCILTTTELTDRRKLFGDGSTDFLIEKGQLEKV